MSIMDGGQALAKSLYREGVRVIFGLPGAGQYEAIDAIYQEPGIRYITTRHEQVTSYMANGYAKLGGGVGTALVVPGPGFYNTTPGLATAYDASMPVLVITGAPHYSHGSATSAEEDLKLLRPITKWAGRAESPADIPGVVHEAFRHLTTGRRRPVVVEIASTTFAATAEVALLESESYAPPPGDPDRLEHAARLLAEAKRPLIWVGLGASDACAEVQNLAEHLQAPVVTTRQGKGIVSHRHPLSLGMANPAYKGHKTWLDQRDVILVVGAGAGYVGVTDSQKVIRIDLDEEQIAREDTNTYGIVGDARQCMGMLHRLVAGAIPARQDGVAEEVQTINAHRFGPEEQLQPQRDFIDAIRAALPDDGVLVAGMNQMGYYSRNYFHGYSPRTYISSHGNLGCVYPLALGAKIARPDKAVVSISGDGGFLYNAQEMATAVQYGIHVVAIVFNDHAYGNVMRAQEEEYDGHVIGTRLHNPDFVKMAEAFGVQSVRAESAAQLESSLRDALAADKPALIEVPVGKMERRY